MKLFNEPDSMVVDGGSHESMSLIAFRCDCLEEPAQYLRDR